MVSDKSKNLSTESRRKLKSRRRRELLPSSLHQNLHDSEMLLTNRKFFFSFTGNSMLTQAFAPFNQFIPSPPIYSSPPQIFYWTGYGPPSGPISPTYIQPLPIPPHAFHHFSPERPPTLVRINLFLL